MTSWFNLVSSSSQDDGVGVFLLAPAPPHADLVLVGDSVDDFVDVLGPDAGHDLQPAAHVVVVVVPGGLVEGVGDGAGRERAAHAAVPHVVKVPIAGAHPALHLVRHLLVHLPAVPLRLLVAPGALDGVAPAVALLLGDVLAVVRAGDLVAVLVVLPVAGLVLLLPRVLLRLILALGLVDGLAGRRVVRPDLAALAVLLPVLLARLRRAVVADLFVLGVIHRAPVVVALLPPFVVALLSVLDVLDGLALLLRLAARPRR